MEQPRSAESFTRRDMRVSPMARLMRSCVAASCVVLMAAVSVDADTANIRFTGVFDSVTAWTRNLSIVDLSLTRAHDTEWYARHRAQTNLIASIDTTYFVLALEIDFAWGQVAAFQAGPGQRFATSAGVTLNGDVFPVVELKWGYTDFLVPLVPWPTRLRLGAQPFVGVTYKPGLLASGDFAGVRTNTVITPGTEVTLTYAPAEEEATGAADGFLRGDDHILILSGTLQPWPGLSFRPVYAFVEIDGTTSGAMRQGRGGLATGVDGFPRGVIEQRHTVGFDSLWRFGAVSIEPAALYQWGRREILVPAGVAGVAAGGTRRDQPRSAWIADVRASWYSGPLLVDGVAVYTTGNKARDDVRDARRTVRYYEPIDVDGGYGVGLANIFTLGVDYTSSLLANANGLNPVSAIGYDKYGLMRGSLRAMYAFTPAFGIRTAVHHAWTAEKVDTHSRHVLGSGLVPSSSGASGRHRDLGTEVDIGFQYALAPGLVFDAAGGWLFSGPALATETTTGVNGPVRTNRHPRDAQIVAARVRFSF